MHLDWPMLGIWVLWSAGVLVAYFSLRKIAGGAFESSLAELIAIVGCLWTLATAVARSLSSWSVPQCWLAGLAGIVALYGVLYLLFTLGSVMWDQIGRSDQSRF